MSAHLQQAIEQLYHVFARYPLNPDMEGSPLYAYLDKWNRDLAAEPLRELSADDLVIFYFKAMTTWGDVADFKHFLPRIFELLTSFRTYWEEWVALDKLNYGCWRAWPQQEQEAVLSYLLAFWDYLLTTPDELADVFCGNYFEAIANVYPDLPELLRRWEQAPTVGLVRLGYFVSNNFEEWLKTQRLSAFDQHGKLGPAVLAWLATDTVLVRLQAARATAPDDFQAEVSEAVQLLTDYRRQIIR
ncbi:hypothetical protein EJV47_22385 [Hymenobacter gummosus]|uniref:Uncharacterized protein n=1 Tax=Hymenobacter gummosus TaxID=1776032 RepID=A0A431TXC3_9BACT|nr:hypothetical protein [Hymenobacter gummosus]RTQ46277.1 hypothetical protein EJV47_22385 [Hymenobacter gummosus]